jgi:hypothetical protein
MSPDEFWQLESTAGGQKIRRVQKGRSFLSTAPMCKHQNNNNFEGGNLHVHLGHFTGAPKMDPPYCDPVYLLTLLVRMWCMFTFDISEKR